MKIYHNLNNFTKLNNAVVTIGTFDGVHLGHQKIIKRMTEFAKRTHGETVILTFFPHPRMIVDCENRQLKVINTIQEKAKILEDLGVNHLIITPFTRDFSNLSPADYIKNILIDQIGTKHIIVGYDHRFGKNRSGGMAHLQNFSKQYGFTLEEIAEQDIHDVAISSTKIRTALLTGNVSLAKDYLGYYFSINGLVIKGDKIGRTIGFPTANLFVEDTHKLIPCDGIYAVTIEMEPDCLGTKLKSENFKQPYKGMAYIGKRPTINSMTRNIEVNIFNFNKEIYGQTIKINFMKFLRPDIKFPNLEVLTTQLHQDKADALSFFNRLEK